MHKPDNNYYIYIANTPLFVLVVDPFNDISIVRDLLFFYAWRNNDPYATNGLLTEIEMLTI